MKKLACLVSTALFFVLLGASGAQAQTPAAAPEAAPAEAQAAPAAAAEDEELIVEEEAVVPEKLSTADVEAAAATEAAADGFLGIPEYKIIGLLGLLTWLFMAIAVGSRLVKSRKHAMKLFKLHKYAAWVAFALGTLHGLIVLF